MITIEEILTEKPTTQEENDYIESLVCNMKHYLKDYNNFMKIRIIQNMMMFYTMSERPNKFRCYDMYLCRALHRYRDEIESES